MILDMRVSVADNMDECDQETQSAIVAPANEEMASSRIKTFTSYVRRTSEQHPEGGGTRQGGQQGIRRSMRSSIDVTGCQCHAGYL